MSVHGCHTYDCMSVIYACDELDKCLWVMCVCACVNLASYIGLVLVGCCIPSYSCWFQSWGRGCDRSGRNGSGCGRSGGNGSGWGLYGIGQRMICITFLLLGTRKKREQMFTQACAHGDFTLTSTLVGVGVEGGVGVGVASAEAPLEIWSDSSMWPLARSGGC